MCTSFNDGWEYDFETPEEAAFRLQAPKERFQKHAPKYHTVVRAPQPSSSFDSAADIHNHWLSTGKIATIRTSGPAGPRSFAEAECLMKAYRYGLKMDRNRAEGADFRDALVDAVAKYADDNGLFGLHLDSLFNAIQAIPYSKLERLVAFYFALSTEPGSYKSNLPEDKQFKQRVLNAVKSFPKNTTYKQV